MGTVPRKTQGLACTRYGASSQNTRYSSRLSDVNWEFSENLVMHRQTDRYITSNSPLDDQVIRSLLGLVTPSTRLAHIRSGTFSRYKHRGLRPVRHDPGANICPLLACKNWPILKTFTVNQSIHICLFRLSIQRVIQQHCLFNSCAKLDKQDFYVI